MLFFLIITILFTPEAYFFVSSSPSFTYSPPGQRVSGRHGKGGIFGSATVDPGPECCQICTKKIYHSISLLDLNEKTEQITLNNFHRYREHYYNSKPGNTAKSFLQTRTTNKFGGVGGGLMSNAGGAMGAGAANSHGQSTKNAYGGVDVLERISYIVDDAKQNGPHEMKSTPPLIPNPDSMNGAMGGGKCCNVCALWFIPFNQRLHLQGDIAPEYGKATMFLEKQNKRMRHTNTNTNTNTKHEQ